MNDKKKSRVIFNLEFTTSKLLAYFIALAATISGIIIKSSEVLIVGWTISAALSGVKTITDKKKAGDFLTSAENTETNKEILKD